MNKVILMADLLICSVWAIFVWHFGVFSFEPAWTVALFVLYPVFLRLNISFMLFRNDKRSVWGVLTFIVLSLPGVFSEVNFKVIDRMLFYSLYSTGIIDCPTHLLNNEWLLNVDITSGYRLFFYFVIILLLAVWIGLGPVFVLISETVRKKMKDSAFSWYSVWMGYFQDPLAVRYFSLFVLVWIAFMIGAAMPYRLSLVATWVMPCVAYYLISKYIKKDIPVWVYIMVVLSSVLFWYSQYTMNAWRIGLLVLSGVLTVYASYRLWKRCDCFIVGVFTLIICGFVLPSFTIGYNVYSVIDAKRVSLFCSNDVKTGVLRIVSDKGTGLRDRYGVIVEPVWERITLACEHSQKPYIVVTKNGLSKVFDFLDKSYVQPYSSIDDELQINVRSLLNKFIKEMNAISGQVIVMESETGRVKAMVGLKSLLNEDDCFDNDDWTETHETDLMRPVSLLAALETGKVSMDDIVDTGCGKIRVRDIIKLDSYIGLVKVIENVYGTDINAFRKQLRFMGYGQPYFVAGSGELPVIKNPSQNGQDWLKINPVWLALGYEQCLAPFQMITLYNAIVNDGRMISPSLSFDKEQIIDEQMASAGNISSIKEVLTDGSSKVFETSMNCPVAGIFGMNRLDRNLDNVNHGYKAADAEGYFLDFCGYTLSGKTKYTLYILVNKPGTEGDVVNPSQLKPLLDELLELL